jgi:hypothetical protein
MRRLDQFSMICTVMYDDESAESFAADAFYIERLGGTAGV